MEANFDDLDRYRDEGLARVEAAPSSRIDASLTDRYR